MCGFESVVLNELCGCGVGEWCGFDVVLYILKHVPVL